MKCAIPRCNKKDIEVIYYGHPLCTKHWMCGSQYLKRTLKIKEDEQQNKKERWKKLC